MPDTALDQSKHAQTSIPAEDLILRRWSPRSFSAQAVTDSDLESIFTAGIWAASSYNEQPWRFLVGRKGDDTYTSIFGALVPPNQSWNADTPVLIASFGKKTFTHNSSPNSYNLHDTGAATQNMALQATALGLHMHGMGGFDQAALRKSFNVPDDFECGACWALGYLDKPEALPEHLQNPEKAPRTRKPLGEVVFTEWDKPADF